MGRPRVVTDREILTAARASFMRNGTAIPISEIAEELGISHATVFNRFGSKEDLMIAALGPPAKPVSVALMQRGPDDRPIRDQLEEVVTSLSREVAGIVEGMTLLRGAGISPERIASACHASGPAEVHAALAAWLERAQKAGGIGSCDVVVLARAIVGSLRDRTRSPSGGNREKAASDAVPDAKELVDLLWRGIAP